MLESLPGGCWKRTGVDCQICKKRIVGGDAPMAVLHAVWAVYGAVT